MEEIPAEMKQIHGITLEYKTPADCETYSELLDYAKKHGYKRGWAWYQAKAKGWLA